MLAEKISSAAVKPAAGISDARQASDGAIEFSLLDTRLKRGDFVDPSALSTYKVLESPSGLRAGKVEISTGSQTIVADSFARKGLPEVVEDSIQAIGDAMAKVLAEKITGKKDYQLPAAAQPTPGFESTIVNLTRSLLSPAA